MSRRETREETLRREADELAEKMESPEYLAEMVSMMKEHLRTDSPQLFSPSEPDLNIIYMKGNGWKCIKVPGDQNKNGCEDEFFKGAAAASASKAESEQNKASPDVSNFLMKQSNLLANEDDGAALQIPPSATQKE